MSEITKYKAYVTKNVKLDRLWKQMKHIEKNIEFAFEKSFLIHYSEVPFILFTFKIFS